MKVRNVWIANLIAYGGTWLLLAGISVLTQAIWGVHLSLWWITMIVVIGAIGDGFRVWFKSKQ